MIKCKSCGVFYSGKSAVCPVCHTVDADNLGKLMRGNDSANNADRWAASNNSAEINIENTNAIINADLKSNDINEADLNKKGNVNKNEDFKNNDKTHNGGGNKLIKAENLGKGTLRAAFGEDSAFRLVTMRKRLPLAPVHIYTITALIAVIIGALLNYFVTPQLFWSPIVPIAAVYGLFTILNTVESQTSVSVKTAYQIAAVSLGFYCCSLLFPYREWYADYCLPTIMLVGMTLQFMFMLETHNKFRPHYVSTVCVAALGYIPIIVAIMQDADKITSYVSAGVATFIIFLTVLAGGKAMWTEMRGRFEY